MNKKMTVGLVLILLACGCASTARINSMPEEKLYFSIYASEHKKQVYRQELVRRNPEWPEEVRQNVTRGKITEGMSKMQVMSSYGKPLEILSTTNEEHKDHSLWIYPEAYLIFDNDQLVNLEEVIKVEVKPSIIEKERYGLNH